jgi:hypothetical protein
VTVLYFRTDEGEDVLHEEGEVVSGRKKHPRGSMLQRVNRAVTRSVRALAESPWMKFTTGAVLLTSGLDEAIDTLFSDLSALKLGAHHGVMMLGFVNVLSALPDMLDGLVGTVLLDDETPEDEGDEDGLEPAALSIDAADPTSPLAETSRRAA